MRHDRDSLFAWAKDNRKRLTREFFAKKKLLPSNEKIAIFMAGSPWAGKTEFINRLLTKDQQSAYYVLDLDKIRSWMPGYKGNYAEKYTRWAIKILEMLFDECVSNSYNFILDGTFTSSEVIDRNIGRLIQKWYKIEVFYIHTQPYLAWIYTLLRGSDDNRRVPLSKFIRFYHLAFENVKLAITKFDGDIKVSIVQKTRDANGNIIHDENIYTPNSPKEMNNIFDKDITFYYTLWKDWIMEKFFFYFTKFLSLIPYIWKPLLRNMAQIAKER